MIRRNTIKYSTVTCAKLTKHRHLDWRETKKNSDPNVLYDRTLGIVSMFLGTAHKGKETLIQSLKTMSPYVIDKNIRDELDSR